MGEITVSRQGCVGIAADSCEEKRVVEMPWGRVAFLGHLRFDVESAASRLAVWSGNETPAEVLDRLFRECSGEYVLVIETSEMLMIVPAYTYPVQYRISGGHGPESRWTVTTDEGRTIGGGYDPGRLGLRVSTKHGFFIAKGVGRAVSDVLIPGMAWQYDKRTGGDSESWVMPLSELASRTDHEELASELAEALCGELEGLRRVGTDAPISLQLSSGVDSALLLAAAREQGLPVQPIHFSTPGKVAERIGAARMAAYLGYTMDDYVRGPGEPDGAFSSATDITSYLEKASCLLGTGSGQFIVDNASLLARYQGGYGQTIEGSTYPTQLCFSHETGYCGNVRLRSLRWFPRFDPLRGAEQRRKYSVDYAKAASVGVEEGRADWVRENRFPDVHPYYYTFLNCAYTQSADPEIKSPPLIEDGRFGEGQKAMLAEAIRENGDLILEKALKDDGVNRQLAEPDPDAAIRVRKAIFFIVRAAWSQRRHWNYRQAGIMCQHRPGLSSQSVRVLLSATVDRQLVDYPKWHVFRAFEKIAGKSFHSVHRATPLRNSLTYQADKLRRRVSHATEPSDYFTALAGNTSLSRFLAVNHVEDKAVSILPDAFKEVAYRIGSKQGDAVCRSKKTARDHLHLMNGFLNIAFLDNRR